MKIIAATCCALVLTLPLLAGQTEATIFEPGDAGPSVLATPVPTPAPATPAGDQVQAGMKLLRGRIHALGGGVRGFGILAKYPAPGPKRLVVNRRTTFRAREPYAPVALIRVLGPTGKTIQVLDITNQLRENQTYTIAIPDGSAGVYSFAMSGGRNRDDFTVQFPSTEVWGVRGEMSLENNDTLPHPAYLYVPRTVKKMALQRFGGSEKSLRLSTEEGTDFGLPQKHSKSGQRIVLQIDDPKPDSVLTLSIDPQEKVAFLFDGVPGLLCPSSKVALILKGGTEEAAGLLTAGPLQARARRWMANCTAESLKVEPRTFDFDPKAIPHPMAEAQIAGALVMLQEKLKQQHLHTDCPFFGGNNADRCKDLGWPNFHYRLFSPWYLQSLAIPAGIKSPINPYYNDPALLRRVSLAALVNIAALQGDGLIREGFLGTERGASYPITHAFFVYGALAENYVLLKDLLEPEVREIWRDGLLQIGDRLADFQGYQSNQWSHNLVGHLANYEGTGEERYLHVFETQLTAYLSCAWGTASKFGQHPTGFYLEQYGADGNYGNMNLTSITRFYTLYKDLPDARPGLVMALRDSIEKNLRFKSLFWLPLGKRWMNPTCFNSRRCESSLVGSNPYGDFLASREFDLGATRAAKHAQAIPPRGVFPASVFSYYANTEEWGRRMLEDLKAGKTLKGTSLLHYRVYRRPLTAQTVTVPAEREIFFTDLPGLIAAKNQGIYSLCFYDVAGASPKSKLLGFMEGGPTGICTDELGLVFASMAPVQVLNKVTTEDHLTFSCAYGKDTGGKLLYSGKARAKGHVKEAGKAWSITSSFGGGELTWSYRYDLSGLTVSVQHKGGSLKEAWINLPMLEQSGSALKAGERTFTATPGRVIVRSSATKQGLVIDCPASAELTPSLSFRSSKNTVRCLRIPLVGEKPTTFHLTRLVK